MRSYLSVPILALVLATRPAVSEIAVAPTLEWLADHCIASGIYTARVLQMEGSFDDCYTITFELKEAFRGKPEETTKSFYQRLRRPEDDDSPVVEKGDEFLICFQHYETGGKRIVHLINLARPQRVGCRYIAVTADLKLLDDGEAILKVFRNRLEEKPVGDAVLIDDYSKDNRGELQPFTELFSAVYGGSACYLRMPADAVQKAGEIGSATPSRHDLYEDSSVR